jgi:drug/metabolite transporter (DMT)-like permease
MRYIEKHPMIMVVVGLLGVSLSSIFVRLADGPSVVTAACRLLWTVLLLTPVALGKKEIRNEILGADKRKVLFCILSGICLAAHFTTWFESLKHTSVASSTAIVCTEVIWVSIGYCLFMKGKMNIKVILCIAVMIGGSMLIAFSDSMAGESHLYGDLLAVAGAISVAGYTLIGKEMRKSMTTTAYTYIVYATCALVLVATTFFQGYGISDFSLRTIGAGFFLGVVSTILGHSVFSWCLKYFSPSFVASVRLLEPVIASIVAIFLFQEIPVFMQVLGGLIVLGGVFVYSKYEQE